MKKNPGRNVTLHRVLTVARQVHHRRYLTPLDIRQLAIEHEVCRRTIYRDLDTLQAVGWPVPRYRSEAHP